MPSFGRNAKVVSNLAKKLGERATFSPGGDFTAEKASGDDKSRRAKKLTSSVVISRYARFERSEYKERSERRDV